MAAPMSWRSLLSCLKRPAVSGVLTRISDRLFRRKERSRGSSVFLLAPLLGEVRPLPALAQPRPPACPATSEGLLQRFHWVADQVPAFRVSGGQVHVLHSPDEFYQIMKANIKTAKRRVVMASLYLGTGPLEQELVDCLQEALKRSREERMAPDLKVSILLDYSRGSRGKKNSRSMLLPLLQRFPGQMRVSLYHTPDLRGVLKTLVPERFNETIGLQHIKVYVFDDNLIISGANLSDSYFTNRQDRYILLRDCAELADFFSELVGAVGDVSLQLQRDDTVQVKEGMVHPYKGDHSEFCTVASKRIMQVVDLARARQQLSASTTEETQRRQGPGDTLVFPLVQMKPLGIRLDEMVTKRLLTEAGDDSRVFLTSGYFNLTRAYMELVLGTRADYRILLASPEVNGFFGAKGVAGAIPAAYIHIARQFYSKVCRGGQQDRIRLHEYIRRDWTFHAKGLWYYFQGSERPCLTLIGSPNFGYRSVHRDLEAQLAIVTENQGLQAELQQEQERLYAMSTEVSPSTFEQPNRTVKLWVKLVTPLIKNFF
ncbi:CDP-diacylglycerol--glycerol-3-phosphate 3-phosphatidyltransferase, mitochondrial [Acipenser ruthenus]|uniref:CDP-diacylglycerol--glycerol-3-phosphate 3-phosphatidyltransferase n=1 Tax=Acipenser ruthenus TaxID=7906 RepID=A0A662Z1B8_ACIRT|nr:CDP-diacylglycerol--glycerol-3-phosphate 3-phosphatidyltransferase, mitochondrial [Acipenser ruthenus]XP_033896209.2 CDP-diacylglycerol--glycerol-3-phosphate 3-phosphatidyltransferase, mitochondrial [Acipenser ruthenus]XP_058848374.1 CDP-diacylglycerol--glycerol-3-phosphate 3-phosphatidyltransferase, mitochondrial [Acipenser ruthenus]XP_058848375.1 CDP-diacylglycerol--glycerol-3-phosphate 3-phosphatidyltransferase, mitochondrial [Acipenser ruthenus]XP_058848376.1 CDP-diacylglycerol--glycerol